jgi:hypothetical protein
MLPEDLAHLQKILATTALAHYCIRMLRIKTAAPPSAESDAAKQTLYIAIEPVPLVIVVVFVPVVLGAPLMRVFVPPLVLLVPAAFTLFGEFVAPVIGVLAVRPIVFDGFVQLVINSGGFALAIVVSVHVRRGERKQSGQYGKTNDRLPCIQNARTISHRRYFLL